MRNKNLSAAFAKFAMPVVLLLLILCWLSRGSVFPLLSYPSP